MTRAIQAYKNGEEREDGFTLIELLVVVIIIGILAAIAIPAFLNQRERAYFSAAESDARNAAIEIESEFAATDAYPTGTDTSGDATAGILDNVETSANVTLVYTLDTGGNTYTIQSQHTLADGDGDGDPNDGDIDACYDSDGGGIVPTNGATCP